MKLFCCIYVKLIYNRSPLQMFLYKLFEVWGPQKLEKYFKDIQKFHRERRDIMLALVEKHLTGI